MQKIYKSIQVLLLSTLSFNLYAAGDAKHFPGIFLGATHAESDTNFTYGIEYEYKFTPQWGVGAVYEDTADGHDGDGVEIKLGALYYHPKSYLRVGLGIGEEKIGGKKPKTKDVVRLSINYDYHFGDYAIAPLVAVDFIDGEEAWVVGVAFVRPF